MQLERVIDEHSVEITKKEDVQNSFLNQRNLAFSVGDHQMANFYSCDFIKKQARVITYSSVETLLNVLHSYLVCRGPYKHHVYHAVHHALDIDTSFVLKCVSTSKEGDVIIHHMRIQPVNMFGPRIMDTREDAEATEINIVPVCIDNTDWQHGDMMFIECGELDNDMDNDMDDDKDDENHQTRVVNMINEGENDKKQEFFDKLFVAFYDGEYTRYYPEFPRPQIDRYEITTDNEIVQGHSFQMRIGGKFADRTRFSGLKVDHSKKFTFTFIADSMPEVRSIFLIHGKKFLGEKITATLSEEGVSQRFKLSAYRVED